MMRPTLQAIFESHFAQYAAQRKLPLRALRAAGAIQHCRTPALGGHIQRCPEGHVARVHYNACRHRSCPRCSALPRARWAEAQAARLLDCAHYHVVFTLPHELMTLWEHNRAWFTDTLFQCARETLMDLCADARFLGAAPGIVMALHTWGRTLNPHPHVHCHVIGGGLTPAGDWKAVRNGYLLPVRVVKNLYRGKMLAAIGEAFEDDRLRLPAQAPGRIGQRLCVRSTGRTGTCILPSATRTGTGSCAISPATSKAVRSPSGACNRPTHSRSCLPTPTTTTANKNACILPPGNSSRASCGTPPNRANTPCAITACTPTRPTPGSIAPANIWVNYRLR